MAPEEIRQEQVFGDSASHSPDPALPLNEERALALLEHRDLPTETL